MQIDGLVQVRRNSSALSMELNLSCTNPPTHRNGQWLVDSPHEGPVMWNFDVFFVVNLNMLFNKQSSCQWFETKWHLSDFTVISMHCSTTFAKEIFARRDGVHFAFILMVLRLFWVWARPMKSKETLLCNTSSHWPSPYSEWSLP